MPYITKNDRDNIDLILAGWVKKVVHNETTATLKDLFYDLFAGRQPTAGELNYIITTLIHSYIKRKGLCYTTINEVVGAIDCSKLELYRRVTAPYEDKKVKENGCISDLDDDSHEKMR